MGARPGYSKYTGTTPGIFMLRVSSPGSNISIWWLQSGQHAAGSFARWIHKKWFTSQL